MADKTLEQAREIFKTVRLLQERLVRQFDRIQKESAQEGICTDLTFPQCNAMMVIHERGVVTIKELSAALQVSSPSASTMVDRLVEMGMLLREQSKSDRREVAVRLSESGKRSIQFMEEQFLASIQGLLYQLGAEFSQQWCDIYQHIRFSLKAAAEIEAIDAQEALDSQRQAL